MTDDILNSPITYLVKISRSRTETAIIPVVAMDAREAENIARSKIGENCHSWRPSGSEEIMHGIVGTRGIATESQTLDYRRSLKDAK
ncbi:hypothetical protein UFOVP237_40 [uncultured Caudovirales phage]|uniref:Uncharacterized protein n=1 Tax=uncultured Caudovirales phage TaxID=2100421 RepID=A0A6J7WPH5_9CAUD|nr:hypothetical protein UFOVP237_40 [uncultured Caudovirales phage]